MATELRPLSLADVADSDELRWREYLLDELAKWRGLETHASARANELLREIERLNDDAA